MRKLPKILITNDDGIHAPGIRHLWNALKNKADVIVVAPSEEQSAVSLSITLRSPLHIHKVGGFDATESWSVTGTPADCVKLALSVILDQKPDLVVSGINRGTNSGRNILYSGTVAGTIEAVMRHIPGIAFSCQDYYNPDFVTAEAFIPKIVDYVLAHPLSEGSLLNVNFPGKDHGKPLGVKLTRQGKGYWMENPDKRHHPSEGHSYYWLGTKLFECDENMDSDVYWLQQGYVAAVPVHVGELTDHGHLSQNKKHFDSWFAVTKT
jgi:5'-nucleotidase